MPRDVQLADGTIVRNVPDDAGDFGRELNPFMAGLLQTREYIVDRLPDAMRTGVFRPLPNEIRQAVGEQQPVASAIGETAVPLAAGLLAPGKVGWQALVAGTLEAAREGSDWQSIGKEAALAGGLQGVGNMASRVASGIARTVKAARGNQILTTTSKPARLIAETGISRGVIDDLNQKVLLQKLGKVFGIDDMTELGSPQLAEAAENIGAVYDDALDFTGRPDLASVRKILESPDLANMPGRARLLEQLNVADTPDGFRAAHRAMRDLIPKLQQSQLPIMADDIGRAVTEMDRAGAAAGADIDLLKEANQRWKLFRTVEETPEAWIDGKINPRQIAVKMGREGFKGFGTALKRDKGTITGTVQDFADDVLTLAADRAPVGSSGTAERAITAGGIMAGAGGLMSGAIDPATAGAGLLAYGVIPPAAALASVGEASPVVGKGLAATRTLVDDNQQ